MRVNRLDLRAQQRAMKSAANRAESLALQSAVSDLASAVAAFHTAVLVKTAPPPPPTQPKE